MAITADPQDHPMTATLPPHKHATLPRAMQLAPIQADLELAEQIFVRTLAGYRSPVASLVEHLRHYRGKRLRPALVYLTARACGSVSPAHHTLAAAVEMIHTATLVHDDVLDESDLRRHVPTMNAEWGNKVSILFGDALFTHAFHLASTVDSWACQAIGEATNRVCAGELRQVCSRGNLDLTEVEYFSIIEGKTAALTECCARLGAKYAGASDTLIEQMGNYGRWLGMAFQIADDLLDLTGNEQNTGKTLGTDLEQRKMTLPLIHALQTLDRGEAEALRSLLLESGTDHRRRVVEYLNRAGSLRYARERAEELIGCAQSALAPLPESPYRSTLESIVAWSLHRQA